MIFFFTEYDGSEFDPFSQQNSVGDSQQNGGQTVDLLGDFGQEFHSSEYSNGIDKHVSFDQESGLRLPNPSFFSEGEGQGQFEGQGQAVDFQRNMSEGEILGYQNEYGGSVITGQCEYLDNAEGSGTGNDGTDIDQVGQGQNLVEQYLEGDAQVVPEAQLIGNLDGENMDPSQNFYEENVENDYLDSEGQGQEQGDYAVACDDGNSDPNSWHPEMTPERSRRSGSPERSVSPGRFENVGYEDDTESDVNSALQQEMDPERSRRSVSPERSVSPSAQGYMQDEVDTEDDANSSLQVETDPERSRRSMTPERSISPDGIGRVEMSAEIESDLVSSPLESSDLQAVGGSSEQASSIPTESQDPRSQSSMPLSSETESIDSRSETEGTTRKSRMKIPKPKVKKPLELPPWDDNVVIPPPPRMKPTLIGKQADLPPPAPSSPRRPKTAPARHTAKG